MIKWDLLQEGKDGSIFTNQSTCYTILGFPGAADDGSASSVGDPGSVPQAGGSPGEGTGYPLQYSCLENSTDRGAWRAIVHGVTKSRTQLSNHHLLTFYLLPTWRIS